MLSSRSQDLETFVIMVQRFGKVCHHDPKIWATFFIMVAKFGVLLYHDRKIWGPSLSWSQNLGTFFIMVTRIGTFCCHGRKKKQIIVVRRLTVVMLKKNKQCRLSSHTAVSSAKSDVLFTHLSTLIVFLDNIITLLSISIIIWPLEGFLT